jgi:hypothetical protein
MPNLNEVADLPGARCKDLETGLRGRVLSDSGGARVLIAESFQFSTRPASVNGSPLAT